VNKTCTPTQRASLVALIAQVLGDCTAFLGTVCVSSCAAALLSGVADGTVVVRQATVLAWATLQSSLLKSVHTSPDAYLRLTDGLSQKYLDCVRGASAAASVGNEGKLKDHLLALLGSGFGLREHMQSLVRIGDNSRVIVRMVRELLAPDPGVCGLRVTASVLETRCYCYNVAYQDGELLWRRIVCVRLCT
jgi:hypothetical protein